MALLIDIKHPDWLTDEDLRAELLDYYPQADIRVGAEPGDLDDIDMLVVSDYRPGEALQYPNLRVVQKTGAGVNNILADVELPASIQVTRLQPDTSGKEMAEYALAYVLQEQRHLRAYCRQQARSEWISYPPRCAEETLVTVLGLGRIGQLVAHRFIDNGFRVAGWSRNRKKNSQLTCYAGDNELVPAIAPADYVISVLPATAQTRSLFNWELFANFKPQAFFINIGRGDLVDEAGLVQALDENLLAGAILDVMNREPLPPESPLWHHPKVQLTPHVSGYHLGDAVIDIAENYRRLKKNQPLLHRVDRAQGY